MEYLSLVAADGTALDCSGDSAVIARKFAEFMETYPRPVVMLHAEKDGWHGAVLFEKDGRSNAIDLVKFFSNSAAGNVIRDRLISEVLKNAAEVFGFRQN